MTFNDGGLALDGCGREIVFPAGTSRKILDKNRSQVIKASDLEENKEYYLYIKRRDCAGEMVAAASSASGCEEKCCPNRIVEDFIVYLSDQRPESPPNCKDIGKGSHLSNCPVDSTEDVFIGSIKNLTFSSGETRRNYVPNSILLSRRLECHIEDQTNPHKTKHAQLLEVLGIDPTKSDTVRDRHVSNADAKRWDSAIYTINDNKPDNKGNFKIQAGDNIIITEGTHEVIISATSTGGYYLEYPENILTLKKDETVKIEHNFNRYPVVDVYEYVEEIGNFVGTRDDITHMAEITGRNVDEVAAEVEARPVREIARVARARIRNNVTLSSNLSTLNRTAAFRERPLTLSPTASLIANNRFSDIADNITVINKIVYLRKITGAKGLPNVEVRHTNRNTVLIKNMSGRALQMKVILTA
ncbi:MAG: hypothetical protein GXO97_02285 [Nitrospirae bacterium]|nr:hypothetical protein [Nitrospirota bacterium]